MFDYISFLNKNRDGLFMTVEDNKPKARGFRFLFAEGNKIFFCTSTEKRAYAQMRKNSNVMFCAHPADFSEVVSIHGKAVFVESQELKTKVLDENPDIKAIYGANNPSFKLLYIDVSDVETFGAGGLNAYHIEK